MKTLVLIGLLVGSVGLNIYLLNNPVMVQDNLDEDLVAPIDEIKMAQSAVRKVSSDIKEKHQDNLSTIKSKFLPKEEDPEIDAAETLEKDPYNDEYEIEYSKQKENWEREVTTFLGENIGLDTEGVEKYFQLMRDREQAISDYISPKIQANGQDQTYMFTLEDNIATAKINEKFLNKLKASLGPDGFKNYQKFKADYNKDQIDRGNAHFFMEF